MRTRKSIKNIATAIILQLVTSLLSFVTRTLLIKSLGIDAVSLNGLFTEVISMLSLTELGVGSAIVFNLYKPLAEGNKEKIAQLMRLFKKAYRIIALATFVIGVALVPVITLLVNEVNYSDNYIRIVFVLFVIQTATSYLFSYKISLLNADQKKYIHSIIQLIIKIISTAVSAVVLFTTYNYVLYLLTVIIFGIITNAVASIVVDRLYPYLKDDYGKLPAEERKQVFSNIKNLFIKNLSGRVTNSTDNILISALVGTLTVGVYTNYSLILNIIKQLSVQVSGGLAGSLGNLFASESKEHCNVVLNRLTFIFFIMASAVSVCLFCCISPFVDVWIGEEWLLADSIVFVCCINTFIDFCKIPLWQSLEVSGLFKKDKNISIIGTVANLIVSIVLGWKWGIVGIFLGTLTTYLIQVIMKIKLLFADFLSMKAISYYSRWGLYSVLTIAEMITAKVICNRFISCGGIPEFLITACIGGFLSLIINLFIFCRTEEMKYSIGLCKKMLGGLKKHEAT